MDGSIWDKFPADSEEHAHLRRYVSTHESGHAVMSVKLGMPFDLVVVGKHEPLRASAAGGIIPKAGHVVYPTPQYIYNRSLVMAAGLAAHLHVLAPVMSGNEDLICPMLGESAATDFDGIRNLWRTYMQIPERDMDTLLEELVDRADKTLEGRDHGFIENVASELNKKSVLSESEVKTICTGLVTMRPDYARALKEIETLLAGTAKGKESEASN